MGRNEEMNESIRKKRMEEIEGGLYIILPNMDLLEPG